MSVSTLADQVGACTTTLRPLHALIQPPPSWLPSGCMAMTPPCQSWQKGKTVTGRIWTYVRDDQHLGGHAPPAALCVCLTRWRSASIPCSIFKPSPASCRPTPIAGTTSSTIPRALRERFRAALCWAHARRQFFELADIAANARRGKNAAAIVTGWVSGGKRYDDRISTSSATSTA